MSTGLLLPLQLAANLLGLGAAAGLAAVVLLRIGGSSPSRAGVAGGVQDALVVAGSVALVVGHGVDGALVPGRADLVGWCLAGGLVLIALGAAPRRLPAADPASAGGWPALVAVAPVLAVPPGPSVVGLAAGALGALRVALGGRATVLVALALGLWGAARGLQPIDEVLSAFCTIGGAVALGVWIWGAATAQLRAKIIVAFVTTVLLLVAALATVLSAGGAVDLVDEEEVRVATSASELASEITRTWPRRAEEQTVLLRERWNAPTDRPLVAELVTRRAVQDLARITGELTQQDAMAIIELDTGEVVLSAGRGERAPPALVAAIEASSAAQELTAGASEVMDVIAVGDRLVALGGGPVTATAGVEQPPPDDPPYGVVAARFVGVPWAEEQAATLPFGVGLEVGGQPGPAAGLGDMGVTLEAVLRDVRAVGAGRGELVVGGQSLIVGVEPVVAPGTDDQLGRVVTVRSGAALTSLQREQARQLFGLALLGGVIAAAVAGIVAGRLLAPVRRLTAAAAAVGRGRLDTTADVDTPDEMGTLGRTFDGMTRSLAVQSRQLQDAANEQARLRARLEALTASMSDGLIATDDDGRVITFNPAAARLTGREPDDVEGLPLDEALRLADGRRATEVLGGVGGEEVRAARLPVLGAGREPVPTDITAAPVRDSQERVVGRVLVLRDVTREAEVERMKTEFLSNVSHELRTPLTPIRGFADVLARRDVGGDDVRRYAEHILDSVERLERVVTRIVDFAALDSGQMLTSTEPVEVGELVDEVLGEWSRRRPQREFRRQVPAGLPPLWTDRAMLTRCLDELVDNAVKFSGADEPVTVSAARDHDDAVRLSVSDRGVGFDAERAAALFGDFYQADASETRHFDGLGLGLALVRRIVDELGGDASVESAPDRGAAFHLLLPSAAAAQRA